MVDQGPPNRLSVAAAGSCSGWDPVDSSHGAHLHVPGAAEEVLWHHHHLLSMLPMTSETSSPLPTPARSTNVPVANPWPLSCSVLVWPIARIGRSAERNGSDGIVSISLFLSLPVYLVSCCVETGSQIFLVTCSGTVSWQR